MTHNLSFVRVVLKLSEIGRFWLCRILALYKNRDAGQAQRRDWPMIRRKADNQKRGAHDVLGARANSSEASWYRRLETSH